MAKHRGEEVWNQIRAEWEAGQITVLSIAKAFGVSPAAIHKRSKEHGWPARDGPPRSPPKSDTPAKSDDPPKGKSDTAPRKPRKKAPIERAPTPRHTALLAFSRAIQLIRSHRADLSALRERLSKALVRIDRMIAKREAEDRTFTLKEELMLADHLRICQGIQERIFAIERRCFGYTDQDGPSEFDTMSDEQLAAIEEQVKAAIAWEERPDIPLG